MPYCANTVHPEDELGVRAEHVIVKVHDNSDASPTSFGQRLGSVDVTKRVPLNDQHIEGVPGEGRNHGSGRERVELDTSVVGETPHSALESDIWRSCTVAQHNANNDRWVPAAIKRKV